MGVKYVGRWFNHCRMQEVVALETAQAKRSGISWLISVPPDSLKLLSWGLMSLIDKRAHASDSIGSKALALHAANYGLIAGTRCPLP